MSAAFFDSFTDEQLVSLIKSGDEKAADALIERYFPLASVKAKKINEYVPLHDVDDLTQEAMTGLLSAIYSYSEDRKACFSTYANVCMNNRLASVANAMRAKRLVPDSVILPLDELNDKADELPDPEEYVITGCTADKISQIINSQLSEFEYSVISLFLLGYKYADIGKKLSSDEKAVDNAMQRIRRKLRSIC
ncbi:MAG: sigma-70 family RNA polymerase sigma factor [Clostridia bacterium]|nr:sigma-70 family RNA polymerase sigma factor [Clostridia bacterium]